MKNKSNKIIISVVIIVIALAVIFIALQQKNSSTGIKPTQPTPQGTNQSE